MGAVVGVALFAAGIGAIVGLFFLGHYVMGNPCTPAAEVFDGGRPAFCEAPVDADPGTN